MKQEEYITTGPSDDAARMRAFRARMTTEQREARKRRKREQYARLKRENPVEWQKQRDRKQLARKERWHSVCVSFNHDDWAHVQKLAVERKCSLNELVRTFVTWALENEIENY